MQSNRCTSWSYTYRARVVRVFLRKLMCLCCQESIEQMIARTFGGKVVAEPYMETSFAFALDQFAVQSPNLHDWLHRLRYDLLPLGDCTRCECPESDQHANLQISDRLGT